MAEPETVKVGAKVIVKEKGWKGTVRYVGSTTFAPGKWIGVELAEPKGKNNGVIQGKAYFQCPDRCGLFLRQHQIQLIEGKSPPQSRIPAPSNIPSSSSSSGIRRSLSLGKRPSPTMGRKSPTTGRSPPQPHGKLAAGRKPQAGGASDPEQQQQPTISVSAEASKFAPEAPLPSDEAVDLQQKLAILQQKRQEDKGKIKELEKFRAQLQQMMEYKARWSESQTELQQQLKAAKKEAREAMLLKEKTEEEMRELSDAVEMTTLDKEMAEERCESQQAEAEALKEKIEELTIDLEIIKQEISDSGVEGAAASAQLKQLEQQNSRLKDALVRLRDLSAEDKMEHQRVVKDLERHTTALQLLKEQKEKTDQELQSTNAIIDDLQEQVDVALGAEEMVEKLTDKNLDLEEKIEQLNENIADLEALRDLSEEQEELRMEVEHELREELDMTQNTTRQFERKLEAAQETIVDQQQTIEKFRDLVHHLQADVSELRQRGESQSVGAQQEDASPSQSVLSLNVQLKSSAIKAHSRTIEFELRKLDAMQATEQINLLKSFMPNTFLVSGGDYDALLVLMLLPRLTFKADLIADQLKQKYKLEEALGSLSSITSHQADQLSFASLLIYKLATLQMLVGRANGILNECDVQLYRQMGGLRDDLIIHEKALDILIQLLKKEQLDETVPLHGVDKAIGHFETLLESRLVHESVSGQSEHLLAQMKTLCAGCDSVTLELLRLRTLVPEGNAFVTQLKEMESFNNDLRQACRKIRRRVPATPGSQHVVSYNNTVAQSLATALRRQLLLLGAFRSLHSMASLRASSLTEGESLTTGELDEYTRQVTANTSLQDLVPGSVVGRDPKELLRSIMSANSSVLEKFLGALQDGDYDAMAPKAKLEPPVVIRAKAVKGELSDVEGLGYKLEERQKNFLELKKTLRLKAQELSEANVKIGLLEKKVESADMECAKKVEGEREEVQRFRQAIDEQERKFSKTIEILQGDIEALESEKLGLERKLDDQAKKTILSDISAGRTLGGRGSPYSGSPYGSPFAGRRGSGGVGTGGSASGGGKVGGASEPMGGGGGSEVVVQDSPLLLSKIESLKKALGYSQDENFRLKTQIAKAQLNSLPPLNVPRRLIRKRKESSSSEGGEGEEGEGGSVNQTDQEKTVMKETAVLVEELNKMAACPQVIDITKRQPQKAGGAEPSPREKLANQLASVLEMQRRKQKLQEEGTRLLAAQYPGGLVSTRLATFASPQFAKALGETLPSALCARIRLPGSAPSSTKGGNCGSSAHRVVLSPAQFKVLHTAIVS